MFLSGKYELTWPPEKPIDITKNILVNEIEIKQPQSQSKPQMNKLGNRVSK
jgi:hypothetical protein